MNHEIINKSKSDNQGSVTMKPGDLLRVVLPSNATTGYSWSVLVNPGFPVHLVHHAYLAPASPQPGAPGHEELLFVAKSEASFTQGGWLRMIYLQVLEQEIAVSTRSDDLWQIHVKVEPVK